VAKLMNEAEKKYIDDMHYHNLNQLYLSLVQSILIANPRGSKKKIRENEKIQYIKSRLDELKQSRNNEA
jgi:hypothetical protein